MGEHVDEVVDDGYEIIRFERLEVVGQFFAAGQIRDFEVVLFDVESEALELRCQEFCFKQVFSTFVYVVFPVLGKLLFHFGGKEA